MSAGAFAARQRAAEGQFFAAEERQAVLRRLEALVAQVGRYPALPNGS
jgi:hypothetical protein